MANNALHLPPGSSGARFLSRLLQSLSPLLSQQPRQILGAISLDVRLRINLVIDILYSYQLKSTLGRLEFLMGVLGVSVLLGIITLAVRSTFFPEPDRAYLTFRVAMMVLATILVLPLVVARLRDIGWHPLVSLLIFVPLSLDPKVMILLAPSGGGSIPTPGWMLLLGPVLAFVLLFFLLTLLFWKGKVTAAA